MRRLPFWCLFPLILCFTRHGGADEKIKAGETIKVGGIVVLPLKSSKKNGGMETTFSRSLKGRIRSITGGGDLLEWETDKKGILLPGEYAFTKARKVEMENLVAGEVCVRLGYKSKPLGGKGVLEMLILDDGGSGQGKSFVIDQRLDRSIGSIKEWPRGKKWLKSDEEVRLAALSLLAATGAGNSHTAGPLKDLCGRLLSLLLGRLKESGGVFSSDNYTCAVATMALCEAYGMTQDPTLEKPSERAVEKLMEARAKDGGWGEKASAEESTPKETLFGLLALKAAKAAGVSIERGVWSEAGECIMKWHEDGGFGGGGETASSGAPLGLILCGRSRNLKEIKRACANIVKSFDETRKKAVPFYLATYSLFMYGSGPWKDWAGKMLGENLPPEKLKGEDDLLYALSYETLYRWMRYDAMRKKGKVIPSGMRWLRKEDRAVVGEYGGVLAPSLRLAILTSDVPQEALYTKLSELCDRTGAKTVGYAALKEAVKEKAEAAIGKLSRALTADCCGYLLALPDGRMLVEVFDGNALFKTYKASLVEAMAVESALWKAPPKIDRKTLLNTLRRALKKKPPDREDSYTEDGAFAFTGRRDPSAGIGIKADGKYIYRLVPVVPRK